MVEHNGKMSPVSDRTAAPPKGHPAPPTVSLLMEALRNPSALVRRWAACRLGQLGAVAVDAIPALRTATSDKDRKVRRTARRALQQLGSEEVPGKTFWPRFLTSLLRALSVPQV